jgi:hypothetical protein
MLLQDEEVDPAVDDIFCICAREFLKVLQASARKRWPTRNI